MHVLQNDAADSIAAAVTLSSPLPDYHGRRLERNESFRYAAIHTHAKVLPIDPRGRTRSW